MTIIAVAVVVIVLLIVVGFVVSYNRFVSQRNLVQESWRQIDVELHRRYDLIPNLVQTVQSYAVHERGIFEDIARLRARATSGQPADLAARARNESELSGALRQLFSVAEAYPELKSSQNFLALQQQLAETEDRIAAGRRFYNANVRAYNTRVEAFPSNLVASRFRFVKAEYFEVDEEQVRAAPHVDFSALTGQQGSAGSSGQPAQPGQSAQPGQLGASRPEQAYGNDRPGTQQPAQPPAQQPPNDAP